MALTKQPWRQAPPWLAERVYFAEQELQDDTDDNSSNDDHNLRLRSNAVAICRLDADRAMADASAATAAAGRVLQHAAQMVTPRGPGRRSFGALRTAPSVSGSTLAVPRSRSATRRQQRAQDRWLCACIFFIQ